MSDILTYLELILNFWLYNKSRRVNLQGECTAIKTDNNSYKRSSNWFFKYFYFLFETGLFYPIRVPAKVYLFIFFKFIRHPKGLK